MLGQACSRNEIARGLEVHGVAPGGRVLIDMEEGAAAKAIATGGYLSQSTIELMIKFISYKFDWVLSSMKLTFWVSPLISSCP